MRKQHLLILSLLVVFILPSSIFLARTLNYYQNDGSDFFSLWLAPHLLIQGEDPYNADLWVVAHDTYGAGWVSDNTYLYPLPLAVVLIPIGLFPLKIASILWIFLSLSVCIRIVWRLIYSINPKGMLPYLLPSLAGIFLFRPTFLTVMVGQVELLILLCLVATAWLWGKGRWFIGGSILSLVLFKPQIGVPLVALWGIWLVFQHRFQGLVGIAIGVVGLFLLGVLFNPAWLFQWIVIGQGKVSGVFGYSPTAWGLAATVCQHQYPCTVLVGAALVVVSLGLGIWSYSQQKAPDPIKVLGIIIPVVLISTPYLWSYTQVLLIVPILLIMGGMYRRKYPYLLVATFPLLMAVLAFFFLYLAVVLESDVWSALVPLISLILLGLFP